MIVSYFKKIKGLTLKLKASLSVGHKALICPQKALGAGLKADLGAGSVTGPPTATPTGRQAGRQAGTQAGTQSGRRLNWAGSGAKVWASRAPSVHNSGYPKAYSNAYSNVCPNNCPKIWFNNCFSRFPKPCLAVFSNICLSAFCFLGTCLLFVLLSSTASKAFGSGYIGGDTAGDIVIVQIDQYEFELELNNSKAAKTLRNALPVQIEMVRWGDQFNGRSPVWIEPDIGAQTAMEIGDIAFWAPGGCICVFFGRTPHNPGLTPKLSSPGLVLGKLKGNVAVLRNLGGTASMFIKEK